VSPGRFRRGRLARAPHEIGENLIGAQYPGPRIDEEDHEIGLLDGSFRLLAHAWRKSPIAGLETRGIDQRRGAGSQRGLGLAPVPRQTRLIVDEGKPFAGEPVEQGRLADIRPSDDGDGEGHWSLRSGSMRTAMPGGRASS